MTGFEGGAFMSEPFEAPFETQGKQGLTKAPTPERTPSCTRHSAVPVILKAKGLIPVSSDIAKLA